MAHGYENGASVDLHHLAVELERVAAATTDNPAPDWIPGLPTLTVTTHREANDGTVEVKLRLLLWSKKPNLTVRVPRETLRDPRLELGAVWTLTPGPRPPSYAELLVEARAALAAANGDSSRLTPEQRSLINYADQPF
jgi:hypothetical protein